MQKADTQQRSLLPPATPSPTLGFILALINIVQKAYVLTVFWQWVAVEHYDQPTLPLGIAVIVFLVLNLIRRGPTEVRALVALPMSYTENAAMLLHPWLVLLIGAIVHHFL